MYTYNRGRRIPSLVEPQFQWDMLSQKNKMDSGQCFMLTSSLHINTHIHASTCTHELMHAHTKRDGNFFTVPHYPMKNYRGHLKIYHSTNNSIQWSCVLKIRLQFWIFIYICVVLIKQWSKSRLDIWEKNCIEHQWEIINSTGCDWTVGLKYTLITISAEMILPTYEIHS